MYMANPRVPKITPMQLVWLAGLLEGEGCFSLQHYRGGKRTSKHYALPSIELGMNDRDVVLRAGLLLGGNQKKPRKRVQRPPHKPAFVWRVNGSRAVHVMKRLLPHMGSRRSKRIVGLVRAYERSTGPNGGRGYQGPGV